MRLGIHQRLEYIEYCLFWRGRVNRKDIMSKFNVSVPQASNDLKKYKEEASKNIYYDNSAKQYVASENYAPVFYKPKAEDYFTMLSDAENEETAPIASFNPSIGVIPTISRKIEPTLLKKIVYLINNNMSVEILYQSMSNPESSWRRIIPQSFVNDGFRWHVRAFCENRSEYRDFLLSRIIEFRDEKGNDKVLQEDVDWHSTVTLKIKPHPLLSPSQKKIIENEYSMSGGFLEVNIKAAFEFYFKIKYGLGKDHEKKPPHVQQIVLVDE